NCCFSASSGFKACRVIFLRFCTACAAGSLPVGYAAVAGYCAGALGPYGDGCGAGVGSSNWLTLGAFVGGVDFGGDDFRGDTFTSWELERATWRGASMTWGTGKSPARGPSASATSSAPL